MSGIDLNTGEQDPEHGLVYASPSLPHQEYNKALIQKQQEYLKKNLEKQSSIDGLGSATERNMGILKHQSSTQTMVDQTPLKAYTSNDHTVLDTPAYISASESSKSKTHLTTDRRLSKAGHQIIAN